MTFLCSKTRSAAPHTPRVVLLGVTGSGKAVQAALLANKYNIVNSKLLFAPFLRFPTVMKFAVLSSRTVLQMIFCLLLVSCGKLIKQAVADETQLGLSCKPYVEKNVAGELTSWPSAFFIPTLPKYCIA